MKKYLNDNIYQINKIMRRAGNVRRFHTHRMTFPESVNTHSFNAALLAYHIAVELNTVSDDPIVEPLLCSFYMLVHDVAEHIVGDVPGHIKSMDSTVKATFDRLEDDWSDENLPDYFNFTSQGDLSLYGFEKGICHFADKFDAFLTAMEELRLGNYSFKFVFWRIHDNMPNLIDKCSDGNDSLKTILKKLFNDTMRDFNQNQVSRGVAHVNY